MNPQTLVQMDEADFYMLRDEYSSREAQGYGGVPIGLCFNLLVERIEAAIEETLALEVHVGEDHLVLTPDREMGKIVVRGNEILTAEHRLISQLAERLPTTT